LASGRVEGKYGEFSPRKTVVIHWIREGFYDLAENQPENVTRGAIFCPSGQHRMTASGSQARLTVTY